MNQLLDMDVLKLTRGNEKKLDSLVKTVWVLDGHKNTVWNKKKCAMLVIKTRL